MTGFSTSPDRRRADGRYFAAIALLFALLVLAGFSRTFYLHAIFRQPAPSAFLQFHGALMTGWVVLLVVQTLLVSARRVTWHRTLGVAGIVYAALIVPVGCMATVGAALREVRAHSAAVPSQLNVLGLELTQLVLFAAWIGLAVRFRSQPDVHKRLMVIATLSIVPNAMVRISMLTDIDFLHTNFGILCAWTLLVLAVVIWDWARRGRLHPAFGWGGAVSAALLCLAWLGSRSATWIDFWTRSLS